MLPFEVLVINTYRETLAHDIIAQPQMPNAYTFVGQRYLKRMHEEEY